MPIGQEYCYREVQAAVSDSIMLSKSKELLLYSLTQKNGHLFS